MDKDTPPENPLGIGNDHDEEHEKKKLSMAMLGTRSTTEMTSMLQGEDANRRLPLEDDGALPHWRKLLGVDGDIGDKEYEERDAAADDVQGEDADK
jgi:hypothetical protein